MSTFFDLLKSGTFNPTAVTLLPHRLKCRNPVGSVAKPFLLGMPCPTQLSMNNCRIFEVYHGSAHFRQGKCQLDLYHVVAQLLEPYTLLVISSLAACVVVWRTPKWRDRTGLVATLCLSFLLVLSTPAVKHLALGSLEWWYTSAVVTPSAGDTIVVLGGSHVLEDDAGERIRLGDTTLARCTYALQLYRRAGRCQIVLSGGKVDRSEPGPALADVMRDYLLDCGVAAEDLAIENNSSTTYENALFTSELLSQQPGQRVFLVTSASHMWRGQRCFRRQGLEVIPAPCEFHAQHLKRSITSVMPSSGGMQGVNDAAHEWLGLAWYWLRGRI
jgi:uncharacterized SAM-binding protein YcdF (DUF218 family)